MYLKLSIWTYLVTVAERKQADIAESKEKELQLQAMLDTTKHVSRAKDQQILRLEQKLQANMKQKCMWKCITTDSDIYMD